MLKSIVEDLAGQLARNILGPIFRAILYWPGWLILRVVTLGHYPPGEGIPHNKDFVATMAIPFLVAVLLWKYS